MMDENWKDKYVDSNEFSYDYYKELVNKYWVNDSREINFQNRVVIPFLDKLLINTEGISIVDVSTQYRNKNSKIHNTYDYSTKEAAPPDLLIVHNWNYANKNNNEINYLAAIEIKSPCLDPIHGKDKDKYKEHTKNEVKSHLESNLKVILTDCIRWQFFERESGFNPIQTIDLFDESKKWKTKIEKTPEFLVEEFQFGPTTEAESDEWMLLCQYIREFLNGN